MPALPPLLLVVSALLGWGCVDPHGSIDAPHVALEEAQAGLEAPVEKVEPRAVAQPGLVNGSFSNGWTGWDFFASESAKDRLEADISDSGGPEGGVLELAYRHHGPKEHCSVAAEGGVEQFVDVNPGHHVLAARVKLVEPPSGLPRRPTARIEVAWMGYAPSKDDYIGFIAASTLDIPPPENGDWRNFSMEVTAPAGARRARVRLVASWPSAGSVASCDDTWTVSFDNIGLTRLPESEQLLGNPEFRVTHDGWYLLRFDEYETDNAGIVVAPGGTGYLRFGGWTAPRLAQQTVELTPGDYTLTVRYRCMDLAGGGASLQVNTLDRRGKTVSYGSAVLNRAADLDACVGSVATESEVEPGRDDLAGFADEGEPGGEYLAAGTAADADELDAALGNAALQSIVLNFNIPLTATRPVGGVTLRIGARHWQGLLQVHEVTLVKQARTVSHTPPVVEVATAQGDTGALTVSWQRDALPEGTTRLVVSSQRIVEPEPGEPWAPASRTVALPMTPQLVAPVSPSRAEPDHVRIPSLPVGSTYSVQVQAIDANGFALAAPSAPVEAEVKDLRQPGAGHVFAERVAPERVRLHWWPDPLDRDVDAVAFHVASGESDEDHDLADDGETSLEQLPSTLVADGLETRYLEPAPFFETAAWVTEEVELGDDFGEIEVWFQTRRGGTAWGEVSRVVPAAAAADVEATAFFLSAAPSTDQLPQQFWSIQTEDLVEPRSGGIPPAISPDSLRVRRGESRAFQLFVAAGQRVPDARVRFGPLLHEGTGETLAPRWLSWHFVDYHDVRFNSHHKESTPSGPDWINVGWSAPTRYPDRLSDDVIRDIEAGQRQPIFIRVEAPLTARPGRYTGHGWLESAVGWKRFEFEVVVDAAVRPPDSGFHAGHWFRWDTLCASKGVEMGSESCWRTLAELARMLRAYRHDFVKVPWTLVRSWRDASGIVHHDFRELDRFIDTFLDENPETVLALDFMGTRSFFRWRCKKMRSLSHRVFRAVDGLDESMDVIDLLPSLASHLDARGLLEQSLVYVADEPVGGCDYRSLSDRVKAAAPALRRIDAIHSGDVLDDVEVAMPPLDLLVEWLDHFAPLPRSNQDLWFYTAWSAQKGEPSRLLDFKTIEARILHWYNAVLATRGYLHWGLNWWSGRLEGSDDMRAVGDPWIVWPSERFIVNSSLRFEAQRDGLDDWHLFMELASQLGSMVDLRAFLSDIVSYGVQDDKPVLDFTTDWVQVEAKRRFALGLISPSTSSEPPTE